MRILVLRGGALGDFVLTLPLLGRLRRRWPDARIELAGNARAAALAVGRDHLDAAHSQHEARWGRLGAGLTTRVGDPEDDSFCAWLRTFDLVINLWPDPDGAIARDLEAMGFRETREEGTAPTSNSERRFVSRSPHPVPGRHAAASLCDVLAPLGFAPPTAADLCARVHPTAEDRTAADALLGRAEASDPLVAWHPGSGSPRKNWPHARWLAVLDALGAVRPFRRVVVLGEAERGTWNTRGLRPGAGLPDGTIVLVEPPIPVLAAIFERCALFLGHDSGPAHVAAAAGCSSVLVFGPTDPAVWAPPHPWVVALRNGVSPDGVAPDDVVRAAGPGLLLHPV